MACNITGTLYLIDGTPAANRTIEFRAAKMGVYPAGNGGVITEIFTTTTDGSGDVDFDLMPGRYFVSAVSRDGVDPIGRDIVLGGVATVFDQPSADIGDVLFDGVIPENPPAWYSGAIQARDDSEQFAEDAEAARDAARDWAESPTPPDGPGTKSSKTWAGEAEAAAADAVNNAPWNVKDYATFAALEAVTVGARYRAPDMAWDILPAGTVDFDFVHASGALVRVVTRNNPYAWGLLGDGVTDQGALLNDVIQKSNGLNIPSGFYVGSSVTIKTKAGFLWDGSPNSGINALSITGPALLTYSGSGGATAPNQSIRLLNIKGSATVAAALCHATVSEFADITCDGFSGVDGIVIEYLWGSRFVGLKTNGATISGSSIKINRVVLDAVVDLPYTSNFSEYNLDIDGARTEYSTGTALGFGNIQLNVPTIQGANAYGVSLKSCTRIIFSGMYTENCLGILKVAGGVNNITFIKPDMTGNRSVSDHAVHIGGVNISAIDFISPSTQPGDMGRFIIGNMTSGLNIQYPQVVGNDDFKLSVKRTADTPSNMPLVITQNRTVGSELIMKTTNFGWKFGSMTLLDSGGVVNWVAAAPWVPDLVSVVPYDER